MSNMSKEDEYFLERDRILREKLRKQLEEKARAAAEHRRIASEVGVDDEELTRRIKELGFDGDNARVLHLMPLVEVAWADGSLSRSERNVILKVAATHGIQPGTPAGAFLASLLESRPSNTVLEEILAVIKLIISSRNIKPQSVLDACVEVAQASGGFLGLTDKVSPEEREMIDKIAASFGEEAKAHVTRKLS
jgi:tellurite resistance protein